MVKAQEWLENQEKYNTKEKRAKVWKLDIAEQLEGVLDLAEFNHEQFRIYIYPNIDTNELQIINQKKEIETIKFISAQEYLDINYPKRDDINLHISGKDLIGGLRISNFSQLEELNCSWNNLTNLIVDNCGELKEIHCYENNLIKLEVNNNPRVERLCCFYNQLTDLIFLNNFDKESLTWLDITNNNLAGDLTIFAQFINLIGLNLGYNNSLNGNLEPLRNCKELWKLDISHTQINGGIEYLSEKLEEFSCEGTKFEAELKDYKENCHYDYQAWKLSPRWKEKGFTQKEINHWRGLNLSPREYELASYLKKQNISFEQFKEELTNHNGNYELWKANYSIKLLEQENTKLTSLENEVERLTNLIKQQKEKIINAYLHFFTEKELLKELITIYLEYKKVQKQKLPSIKLKKQYDKLFDELMEKISEEKMEEVEIVLNDCEELIHYEVELQKEINKNQKLIESHQEIIQQITYHVDNININSVDDDKIKEMLETKLEVISKNQLEESLVVKLDKHLKEKHLPIEKEKETIDAVDNFLKAKKKFLEAREKAIKELQECFNKLENKYDKHEVIGEIGNAISSVGGSITGVITFGIPKAVGETIKANNVFSKIKLSKKGSKDFQDIIQVSLVDGDELVQLDNVHNSLTSNLESKEVKLFNIKHKVYDILITDGIWEGRKLSLEKMEKAIISLSENLEELRKEVVEEEKQFKGFGEELEQQQTNIEIPPK